MKIKKRKKPFPVPKFELSYAVFNVWGGGNRAISFVSTKELRQFMKEYSLGEWGYNLVDIHYMMKDKIWFKFDWQGYLKYYLK